MRLYRVSHRGPFLAVSLVAVIADGKLESGSDEEEAVIRLVCTNHVDLELEPRLLSPSLIRPEPELDAANYLVGRDYERKISAAWFWNAGASWYRDDDAGILNRYLVFGGVGNTWADNRRRRFVTSYGVSYTDREEQEPDPEKDRRFAGTRVRPRRDCLRRAREPGWYPRHWGRTLPYAFIGKHEARARLGDTRKDRLDTVIRTALVIKF